MKKDNPKIKRSLHVSNGEHLSNHNDNQVSVPPPTFQLKSDKKKMVQESEHKEALGNGNYLLDSAIPPNDEPVSNNNGPFQLKPINNSDIVIQRQIDGSKNIKDFEHDPFYKLLTPYGVSLFHAYVRSDSKLTLSDFLENTKDEDKGEHQVWNSVPSNLTHTPPPEKPKEKIIEKPKSDFSLTTDSPKPSSGGDSPKTTHDPTPPKPAEVKSPESEKPAVSSPDPIAIIEEIKPAVAEEKPTALTESKPPEANKGSSPKSSRRSKPKRNNKKNGSKSKAAPKVSEDPILDEGPKLPMPAFEDLSPLKLEEKRIKRSINEELEEGITSYVENKYITSNFNDPKNIKEARLIVTKLDGLVNEYISIVERIEKVKEVIDGVFGDDENEYDADYLFLGELSSELEEIYHVIKRDEFHLTEAVAEFTGDVELKVDAIKNKEAASAELSRLRGLWASEKLAKGHYIKHKADTGYNTEDAYLAAAEALVTGGYTHHKVRGDGDTLYFNTGNGDFGITRADNGKIRTLFRPNSGIAYYNNQH